LLRAPLILRGKHRLHRSRSDGQYIHFHSYGTDAALYRVRIGDHKVEKIAELKEIRLAIGAIGTWCGLAPDGSPLVLRDVGTQEIYALDLQLP
jgi:hypothetical protein